MKPKTIIKAIKATATVLGAVVTLATAAAEMIGQVAEAVDSIA